MEKSPFLTVLGVIVLLLPSWTAFRSTNQEQPLRVWLNNSNPFYFLLSSTIQVLSKLMRETYHTCKFRSRKQGRKEQNMWVYIPIIQREMKQIFKKTVRPEIPPTFHSSQFMYTSTMKYCKPARQITLWFSQNSLTQLLITNMVSINNGNSRIRQYLSLFSGRFIFVSIY